MSKIILPHGLRYVLVYVNLDGVFPPPANSGADIALLRAANLAMRRSAEKVSDNFLFLFVKGNKEHYLKAVRGYGFPHADVSNLDLSVRDDVSRSKAKVLRISSSNDDVSEIDSSFPLLHDECLLESVERNVSRWLEVNHPGSIPYFNGEYDSTSFWWVGIEHDDDVFGWSFEASDFASLLPTTHQPKASTWLTVLGYAMELHQLYATTGHGIAQQRAAVLAATLCEWLHGFESASGNGWNHFESDCAVDSLGISSLFLGFETARIAQTDLQEFFDEHNEDVDTLRGRALTIVTSDLREKLRRELSFFFGGDGALFWALHTAIWPRLGGMMVNECDQLLNLNSLDEYGELENSWQFVSDGWCEAADS